MSTRRVNYYESSASPPRISYTERLVDLMRTDIESRASSLDARLIRADYYYGLIEARQQERVRVIRMADNIIEQARRTIERAEQAISNAREGLFADLEASDGETEADTELAPAAPLVDVGTRRRWERPDGPADAYRADVAEPGGTHSNEINRISNVLELRDGNAVPPHIHNTYLISATEAGRAAEETGDRTCGPTRDERVIPKAEDLEAVEATGESSEVKRTSGRTARERPVSGYHNLGVNKSTNKRAKID
ncbi:uncharacterized protein PGTG_20036 [Puccinia graminis f. sp. tritici CRL 75-36-700-3]|uniref:Uncharacterized protein n=1 Tax=Puccinia graminis f. sp. tritici (strain CRL 75-36-700-3 / race SCCL) TaxID=418459 RepID=E3LBW7_PUCGT|nr:uncharacterized protein PGTG_20036 [Puccinia graminis f. sp. tritici CRL 75-36-700-3]EFP94042.1 hypothetical protein PGTG_20036 [Puccinia graminis f. sp. tritici CRL 75-36-700-3]